MTGGDILIECLKAQGVRCVFGMPGTQNIQIYDLASFRRGAGVIDHYLVRHEYASTQMADGYARSTGEVGVALTVPGPGASNASTGILEAFTDCVPVLLITGQSDSEFYARDPSKMFHGLDQMSFFESVTKYCAIAQTVEDVPKVVEKCVPRHAVGSSRTCCIGISDGCGNRRGRGFPSLPVLNGSQPPHPILLTSNPQRKPSENAERASLVCGICGHPLRRTRGIAATR